jgi:hypothetical protein
MPLFSAFTPFGAGFAFSGAPSHGERIYRNMISLLGVDSLSTEEGTRMRAFCYASAMNAARVRYTLEHAGYQLDPLKIVEMLPLREAEYGLVPPPNDGIDARRAALAARMLAPKGGDFNNIKNALLTLLGDEFVQYVVTQYADAVLYPAAIGDQPMNLVTPTRQPRLLSLPNAISTGLGAAQWVRYDEVELPPVPEVDAQPQQVYKGETYVVDPGNNLAIERIEVLDVREVSPGLPELRATFTKAHSSGTLCTNMPFPLWASTKRANLVVVSALAAADAETRRKINELLTRVVRAVSTWNIVQESPSTPNTTGIFTVGESPLGYQTIGNVTVPL